jgi:hypothetical protein
MDIAKLFRITEIDKHEMQTLINIRSKINQYFERIINLITFLLLSVTTFTAVLGVAENQQYWNILSVSFSTMALTFTLICLTFEVIFSQKYRTENNFLKKLLKKIVSSKQKDDNFNETMRYIIKCLRNNPIYIKEEELKYNLELDLQKIIKLLYLFEKKKEPIQKFILFSKLFVVFLTLISLTLSSIQVVVFDNVVESLKVRISLITISAFNTIFNTFISIIFFTSGGLYLENTNIKNDMILILDLKSVVVEKNEQNEEEIELELNENESEINQNLIE